MRERVLNQQIVVRLDDETIEWLQADAAANERTVAQTIRWLIRRHRSNGAIGGTCDNNEAR